MKKIFCLFTVLFLLLLSACSPKTDTQTGPNTHEYFEIQPERDDAYASAAAAYNTFLNGNSHAIKNSTDEKVMIDDFLSASNKVVDQYVLFDLDIDNSPELHFTGSTYAIFTIVDEQVVLVYSESPKFEFHQLLPIPGVMAMQRSDGVTYRFVTMGRDKSISTTEFTDPQDSDKDAKYTFNGEVVTKENWNFYTKPFFDYTKNAPTIPWANYTKYH